VKRPVLSSEKFCCIPGSVPDPRHFATDPDPDPLIRTLDLRFLPFSSVASKKPTKISFTFLNSFAYYFLRVHFHQSSKIKSH
jgi:hypothetical protein